MTYRVGQRINTVCIQLVRGTLTGATMHTLLPAIIRDAYGVPNEEVYGVALNGMTRVFLKLNRTGVYDRLVDEYQERKVTELGSGRLLARRI